MFSAKKLATIADGFCTCFVVACLAAAALFTARTLLNRIHLRKDSFHYLVIGPSNNVAFEYIDQAKSDRASVTSSSGLMGETISKSYFPGALPSDWVTVKRPFGRAATANSQVASKGWQSVQHVLSTLELESNSKSLPWPLISLGIGALFAFSFPSRFRPFFALFAVVGIAALSYKLGHECPVCPRPTLLGVPIEFLGILSLASLLLIFYQRPGILQIAALATGFTVLIFEISAQFAATYSCMPCAIAGLSFGLIGGVQAAQFNCLPPHTERQGHSFAPQLLSVALALVVPAVMPGASSPFSPSTLQQTPSANVLVGRGLTTVVPSGVLRLPPGPGTLCFVAEGCSACQSLEMMLANKGVTEVKIVSIRVSPGKLIFSKTGRSLSPDFIIETPLVLVYDVHHVIRFVSVGYSDDVQWQDNLVHSIGEGRSSTSW